MQQVAGAPHWLERGHITLLQLVHVVASWKCFSVNVHFSFENVYLSLLCLLMGKSGFDKGLPPFLSSIFLGKGLVTLSWV